MRNVQSPRTLFTILLAEVLIGVAFLVISGGLGTIFTVLFLLLFVGGGLYLLSKMGMLAGEWFRFDQHSHWPGHNYANRGMYINWPGPAESSQPFPAAAAPGTGFINLGLGLNPGLERSETSSQNFPLENVKALQVEVNNGNLTVVGQAAVTEIRLNAVKRVWERDELSARRELERLQVRSRQEGDTLIIEAGQFDGGTTTNTINIGVNINLGKPPRIDLELVVPPELAAHLGTKTGNLDLRDVAGEVAARTVAGTMNFQNIYGGRNLTVSTSSGRVIMQQITAGILRARATTGNVDLTGIGAEGLELETVAGSIRVRGVNCGRLQATATTGSVELSDVNTDTTLQLKATAGRIQTSNVRAAAFNLETTTGAIRYQGQAPIAQSLVQTGMGSTDLIFAPGANFNLDARSNVGSVQVFLPMTSTTSNSRNWFRGQIGAGGPELNVISQVGSVRVSQG